MTSTDRTISKSDEKHNARGAFIVIEGLDRSGKSTQAGLIDTHLTELQIPCVLKRFPDRTSEIGKMLDAYLRGKTNVSDQAIHLLFSANRWEHDASMRKDLLEGKTIICDRYSHSGIAFSASKGLDIDWCSAPEKGLLAPDLVIFMDISVKNAQKRSGFGGERYEKQDMQKRVKAQYAKLSEMPGPDWIFVSAIGKPEEIHEKIWDVVKTTMSQCSTRPLSIF